jgi:hypothetical protein
MLDSALKIGYNVSIFQKQIKQSRKNKKNNAKHKEDGLRAVFSFRGLPSFGELKVEKGKCWGKPPSVNNLSK